MNKLCCFISFKTVVLIKTKYINTLASLLDHNQHQSKVIDFCTSLNKNALSAKKNNFSQTIKLVSDLITTQVIKIINSHLISLSNSYSSRALTCLMNK